MEDNTSSLLTIYDYQSSNETFDTPFTFESTRIFFIILYVTVFITCVIDKSTISQCLTGRFASKINYYI